MTDQKSTDLGLQGVPQDAMRRLEVLDPAVARQAALEAGLVGQQADQRWGAHEAMRIRTPAHGVGSDWVTPAAPPGASWAERATIGVPVDLLPGGLPFLL